MKQANGFVVMVTLVVAMFFEGVTPALADPEHESDHDNDLVAVEIQDGFISACVNREGRIRIIAPEQPCGRREFPLTLLNVNNENVGIGTSDPTEKLDVIGNIRASGSISSGDKIKIDGENETITAAGGTLSFGDDNLVTMGNVGIGVNNPTAALEVNGTIIASKLEGGGVSPIGSIVAWHKSLAGTPPLPDGWAECNGQVLIDADSPYHGVALPDLNGAGRFLRGGGVSGWLQDDQMQGHIHDFMGRRTQSENSGEHYIMQEFPSDQHLPPGLIWGNDHRPISLVHRHYFTPEGDISLPTNGGYGAPRMGDENRPINMSVVWIMRIK